MTEWLLGHEATVRLGIFLGVLAAMACWEWAAPRRRLTLPKPGRWAGNLGLVILDTIVLRLLFPAAALGMAAFAARQGWGVFNYFAAPSWLAIVICVVVLDFAIYLQHVMFHAVPLLWRLHRVHHADLDFDVTTGLRFHPFEIVLSTLIKFAVIAVLGPPLIAVMIFEVLLNAGAMFTHGNVRLPLGLDRLLRALVVTPDMHRVHHSVEEQETNSNFGFNLSLWDRLFGTYRAQPAAGHQAMTIGIRTFRDPRLCARLPGMLRIPFLGRGPDYAINRRGRS
ncbi:MAG: sterol desaturase family protein [Pseudomonadota bacterium]